MPMLISQLPRRGGLGPAVPEISQSFGPPSGCRNASGKLHERHGEVPERSNGTVSKTVVRVTVPWVRRLLNDGAAAADVQKILDRDQGEGLTFGQMTRKVFIESDFFICNDKKKDEFRRQLMRFLQIIFDTNVHTPTLDESAMYEAYSASTGSACMSRQVGAAIVSDGRELISIRTERRS